MTVSCSPPAETRLGNRAKRQPKLLSKGRRGALKIAVTEGLKILSILIIADVHGDFSLLRRIASDGILVEGDTLLVAGDLACSSTSSLGAAIYNSEVFSALPYEVLFIDGNHDWVLDIHNEGKKEKWNGGSTLVFPNGLRYIGRAQVLDIPYGNSPDCSLSFALCGGAAHHVKPPKNPLQLVFGSKYRNGLVAPQQDPEPSPADVARLIQALEERDWRVDLVVTHTPPMGFLSPFMRLRWGYTHYEEALDYLNHHVSRKLWVAGHHHFDKHDAKNSFEGIFKDAIMVDNKGRIRRIKRKRNGGFV